LSSKARRKLSAVAPLNSTCAAEPSKAATSKLVSGRAEILRESATREVRRAVVVKVQEVAYTGEYESTFEDG